MLKNIETIKLETKNLKTNALLFNPVHPVTTKCSIFTHGYTSHKGSILTWAQKMMDLSIPCVIFDLPGHLLGSFENLDSLDHFQKEAPLLFMEAYSIIKSRLSTRPAPIIGGHSLGALLALQASKLEENFQHLVCVGLGRIPKEKVHLFNTPFFKDTMHLRSQLVSPVLHPDVVLPWISDQKHTEITKDKSIILIGGKDDIVIGGEDGLKEMAGHLEKFNSTRTELIPKLPHHLPENAGIFVKKAVEAIDL